MKIAMLHLHFDNNKHSIGLFFLKANVCLTESAALTKDCYTKLNAFVILTPQHQRKQIIFILI